MEKRANDEKKPMTIKTKLLINIFVNLGFAVLFYAIYQIAILKNINIFGQANTDGGFIPKGFSVQRVFVIVAAVNVIVAVLFWLIQKFNIKLLPLILVSVLVPVITYSANYSIFINGSGAIYKAKQTIVMGLENAEKNKDNTYSERLKTHPMFLTKQDNGDFNTYLYINEALDELYICSKLSDDSEFSFNDKTVPSYHYVNPQPEDEEPMLVRVGKNGIEKAEIYKDSLYLVKEDGKILMFQANFNWIIDKDGNIAVK